ncbi:mitochondrial glycine transporter-like [Athalia rosae]|uniref:mitochondrial glycine transporter-like n=1 Tax=Athalia rosae TaxID=37344 RepID=UPI000626CF8D|nr:mitochondrial glycine transporter-like [Athalia rosae]XP_012251642.1 mitochondrial glycine transporter-like [Athalia rosae]XP_012251643.1 mitochondrial glycine transporter-like [Athalia rosae]XP_048512642.1 mitochondrial glycine transporter-like [Athalia rosae]
MQSYTASKQDMKLSDKQSVLKSFVAGSCSGTVTTILFQPLDLIKTRLQSRITPQLGAPSTGMVDIAIYIVRNDNVFGLWKGITPSLIRVVPGVGLYFASLHWLKNAFHLREPLNSLQALTLGITARSMAGVVLIPITVVKTRFESGIYKYCGMREALHVIWKYEGTKGLVCGLVPTLFRDAPFSGLYLLFYTQCKKAIPQEYRIANNTATVHFTCGLLAGLFASVITQPADVIKTRMQLYPHEFKTLYSSFLSIYQQQGCLGYFQGIVPRLLRRTLMSAMAWTIYEEVTGK